MAHLDRDKASRSSHTRQRLNHPVIDADGHWLEPVPLYMDYLQDIGGNDTVAAFLESRARYGAGYRMSPSQRHAERIRRPSGWLFPADALDRVTVSLPALLAHRLGAFGIDFCIVYPSMGLSLLAEPNSDLRRTFCRAYNVMIADLFAEFAHKMTPVAIIPTFAPEEAIKECHFAVKELKLKAAVILGTIQRPIGALVDGKPGTGRVTFIDNLVLDSDHDYDPVWQAFADLGLAVTAHAGSMGWMHRNSPTNFSFNHVGHFAEANHTFARALFFSGVTYRFPELNFAFLEGGVGWAASLLNDLISHLNTRSIDRMLERDPARLDLDEVQRLYREYGGERLAHLADAQLDYMDLNFPGKDVYVLSQQERAVNGGELFDEFSAAHVVSAQDLRSRFADNFYFGCEADDPITGVAFDSRYGERLKAIFGSDIAHFDVPTMTDVLYEAHELVVEGVITDDDFEAFTFGNVVELHGRMNPAFFKGTDVESEVDRALAIG